MALEVPTRYGTILMGINSIYLDIHARFGHEEKFIELIETEDFDVFVDVGAAWGYFSVPAANHCDIVYAFEPTSKRYVLLEQNKKDLKLDNLRIFNKAVGTGSFDLYEGRYAGPKTPKRTKKLDVEWVTLREILEPHLDERVVVKVDVEGPELDVVLSAGDLGQYNNLTWLIERHQWAYNEKQLRDALQPFKGELTGIRKKTSHWIFRR